jgi:hypothetical protein
MFFFTRRLWHASSGNVRRLGLKRPALREYRFVKQRCAISLRTLLKHPTAPHFFKVSPATSGQHHLLRPTTRRCRGARLSRKKMPEREKRAPRPKGTAPKASRSHEKLRRQSHERRPPMTRVPTQPMWEPAEPKVTAPRASRSHEKLRRQPLEKRPRVPAQPKWEPAEGNISEPTELTDTKESSDRNRPMGGPWPCRDACLVESFKARPSDRQSPQADFRSLND